MPTYGPDAPLRPSAGLARSTGNVTRHDEENAAILVDTLCLRLRDRQAQMPPPVPVAAPGAPGAIALYGETVGKQSTEQWVKFNDDYVVRNVTRPR
jgi:hypothetical protein